VVLFLLAGEAGIGKTRLAEEAMRDTRIEDLQSPAGTAA
jgi:MoxR-like ATPase